MDITRELMEKVADLVFERTKDFLLTGAGKYVPGVAFLVGMPTEPTNETLLDTNASVDDQEGEVVALPVHMAPLPVDKRLIAPELQKLADQKQIRGFVLIQEAWMLSLKKKSRAEAEASMAAWFSEHSSLEDHPNRAEGLVAYISAPDVEIVRYAIYTRDDAGTVVSVDDSDAEGLSEISTRFKINWS